MTKYEELCGAFESMKKSYHERKNSSLKFAQWLVVGLVNYLECPPKQVKYAPIGKTLNPNLSGYLPGSARLDENSCWHFGVGIRIEKPPLLPLVEVVVLDIVVDRQEGAFEVKLAALGDSFTIHEGNAEEAGKFYDFAFRTICYQYQATQMRSEAAEAERKIGFQPEGSRAK
jgi:hypothetical protein